MQHRIRTLALLLVLQGPASAPESRPAEIRFRLVPDAFAGPIQSVKCEGVEIADLDGDGKLDVVLAPGFVLTPRRQAPLRPSIRMNRSTGPGAFVFADETDARLPAGFEVQAGGVTAFDIENDGDADLLFAQMGGRPPRLLRNDGKGKFEDVTATHLPPLSLSSPSAEFGDVDDDGDLDVALTDQEKPVRLLLNDGKGLFTDETAARMPDLPLAVAQDATFADVDGDWDLDLVAIGKLKTGQRLYLNDGTGRFKDASAAFAYPGSGNNYECEWADLDDDGDVDGAWISVEGELEGISRNRWAQEGRLAFDHGRAPIKGHNGDDDNEVTLIDADQDGRLDLVIGSLAYATEKLYLARGDGFEFVGGFDGTRDPTCDAAAADLDGDTRPDYVTAVGESGMGNKLYRGTGEEDKLAPKLVRIERVKSLRGAQLVFRVMAQDAVYDDGQDYLRGSFDLEVRARNGKFEARDVAMTPMGAHLFRGAIDLASLRSDGKTPELTGATVVYVPKFADRAGNVRVADPIEFTAGP